MTRDQAAWIVYCQKMSADLAASAMKGLGTLSAAHVLRLQASAAYWAKNSRKWFEDEDEPTKGDFSWLKPADPNWV